MSDKEAPDQGVGSDQHLTSDATRIVNLCSTLSELWHGGYSNPEDEKLAKLTARDMEVLCQNISARVSGAIEGHSADQITILKSESKKFKSGEWRSAIWIDCMYETTNEGEKIDYDWIARSDKGAHLFRIWFTAKGVGIGIRVAGRKTHTTRQKLIDSVPSDYRDLAPLNSGRHFRHDLHLMGRRGQMNTYLAKWYGSFTSDEDFLDQIAFEWSQLGYFLNKYRC